MPICAHATLSLGAGCRLSPARRKSCEIMPQIMRQSIPLNLGFIDANMKESSRAFLARKTKASAQRPIYNVLAQIEQAPIARILLALESNIADAAKETRDNRSIKCVHLLQPSSRVYLSSMIARDHRQGFLTIHVNHIRAFRVLRNFRSSVGTAEQTVATEAHRSRDCNCNGSNCRLELQSASALNFYNFVLLLRFHLASTVHLHLPRSIIRVEIEKCRQSRQARCRFFDGSVARDLFAVLSSES